MFRTVLCICACVFFTRAIAQQTPWEAFTIDQGVSQGMVYDVMETRDGFLWFGTKDGLNRYDGYNFKVWNNNASNPYSLSDNIVTALLEDSRGWIWVGCESRGVNLLDRTTERFYHLNLPARSSVGREVLHDVRYMLEDRQHNIWIVNRGEGIFRVTVPPDWRTGTPETPDITALCSVQQVDMRKFKEKGLQEEFSTLCEMQDGRIWVSSSRGLYAIDPQTLTAEEVAGSRSLSPNSGSLLQTPSGTVWGTAWNKLFRYSNGVFQYFTLPEAREIGTGAALAADGAGGVWVLMEKILWHIPPEGTFDVSQPKYMLDKPSRMLTLDQQANIWVGTLGYGLRKITPRKSMFHAQVAGISIWGLWQDVQGRNYCKLFNKIVEYDPQTQRLSEKSAFPDALPQQNDLLLEPDGDVWLLSGLREGNVNISQLRHYRPDHSLAGVYDISINRYPYARLLRRADGSIWVSGTSGRLLRCDPVTGAMTNYDFSGLFGEQANAVQTIALAEDGNGALWAGTQLGLVKGINKGNGIDFQLFKGDSRGQNALNNQSIACILPDPQNPAARLWIGTKGGGINCLDLVTGDVTYVTTEQGLPNNTVYGILPDDDGNLWGSTNRGLFRMIREGGKVKSIKVFTAADGLQSNEFNTQSFFRAPDGTLLFGGVNGLNRFQPRALQLNNRKPNIWIVGLEINRGQERISAPDEDTPQSLEYLREIRLQAHQNNLSFEFTALDLTDPAKNQYQYQLLPLENDWVDAGARHFAHYTHLSPGHYTFRVKGSNSDGVWNEEPVEIKIFIPYPWWQSRIAKLLYLLAIGLVAWRLYKAHTDSIRLKAQIAYEQREIERVRALEQMKTNFFSNVAHEFRTPLTLAIEPLRQVLNKPQETDWLSKVKLAARNSQRLLHLVNELLDLAKIESGSMKTEYRTGYIADILHPVVDSFAGAAENKEIDLEISIDQNVRGDFDVNKIEKICFNLLSNALKFTQQGGRVEVTVQTTAPPVEVNRTGQFLHLTVQDNGKGIPADELPHVFERFYQANEIPDKGRIGTGIGLALCRELTELMGGKITADSQPGQGSIFHVYLPLVQHITDKPKGNNTGSSSADLQPAGQEGLLSEIEKSAAPAVLENEKALLLLVEDNDELRAFLSQTLSETYEVLEAPDGKKALELATQRVPDLVASDISMPYMDGIELLTALKTDLVTSHIPVLLLTSRTTLENRLEGLQHGADAYLGKPFQTEELLAWIANLLESRRRLQEKFTRPVSAGTKGQPGEPETVATESAPGLSISIVDSQFMEKLRRIAEQEIENEQFSIEDLARAMAMSRSQLHRKLSALTGQSAGEFLRNYRLDRAMELLRARAGNVSEIAWRVGFGNPKYFSTSFKERFGMSPSEVREEK